MRVGALGTLVWDRIVHPASPAPVEQWGGATYSLAALSAAAPPGWAIVPLLKVGEDLAEEARAFVSGMPGLELGSGFRVVPERTNRVELTYTDAHRRGERLTGGVPSWEWEELEPLLEGLDALYLNFISGFEVELEVARRIRATFAGPLYADLHSLFLGCPGAGVRRQRALPEWEEWVRCFDVIQLNEDELSLLAGDRGPDEVARRALKLGPERVAVTRGGAGARIWTRPGGRFAASGTAGPLDVPLPGEALEGDPTGCGDVWGSVHFLGLLEGLEVEPAARRAHLLAAARIASRGTAGLSERLREVAQTAAAR